MLTRHGTAAFVRLRRTLQSTQHLTAWSIGLAEPIETPPPVTVAAPV
jgi:hypothetical protein